MSFNDDYLALREKRKKKEKESSRNSAVEAPLFVNRTAPLYMKTPKIPDDIAPVLTTADTETTSQDSKKGKEQMTITTATGNDGSDELDRLKKELRATQQMTNLYYGISQKATNPQYPIASAYDNAVAEYNKSLAKEKEIQAKIDELTGNVRNEGTWFSAGAFKDGYQFGDIITSILGTAGDAGTNVVKGAGKIVGGVADLGTYAAAGAADFFGADDFAEDAREFAKRNVIDETLAPWDNFVDGYSLIGEKSDSVAEGLGQVGAIILTGGVAGAAAGSGTVAAGFASSAATTALTGLSSWGSGMSEAYSLGATDEEAFNYGLNQGVIDAGIELLFGGLGKAVKAVGLSRGIGGLDDMFARKLSSKISKETAKQFVQYGIKAAGEGFEEVLAGVGSAVNKKFTIGEMSDEDILKLIEDENLLDQFVMGAVTSGIAQSGYVPGMKQGSLRESIKTGKDFITGNSVNEQKVIDKEVENRIAEAEKAGKKLTNKQKNKIYDEVVSAMENGEISIDTIEEVLGGDSYKAYRDTIDSEDAKIKELEDQIKELEDAPNTVGNAKKHELLTNQLEELKNASKRNDLKTQLSQSVFDMVKNDRLVESYAERSRRGQAFEADLTQYDEKQRTVVQSAIDSGILNNTRRTHKFVDILARISADKSVPFNFTDNAKLKESGFALDGKQVNGYITKDGITLNIDSPKAWQSTVGHEITHVLEGTELYNELQTTLFDYAKSKGEYDSRLADLTELYKDVADADVNKELTADLVGDYLFTDADFVNHLSANHRNVFQKIYDEVKYLLKVTTAGSKEARQLEKVKKAFEDAYRGQKNTAFGGINYKLDYGDAIDQLSNGTLDRTKNTHLLVAEHTPQVFIDKAGAKDLKIITGWDTAYLAMNKNGELQGNYHGLGADIMKAIPKALEDPLYIVKQEDGRINAVTEVVVKGNRPALVSVELDVFKTPTLDGNQEADNYNLIVTFFDAKSNYLQNKVFNGEVKYNKNNEDPAHFISRLKSLKKAVPTNDLAESSTSGSKPQNGKNVKGTYSISDSTGKQLTKAQQDFFKDSKMRDDNGNLKVMYHGSQNAGFHTFDGNKSDDGISFFFVDRNDVAASYSGTSETYEAKTIRTPEDMNNFLAEIGYDQYEAIEKDGKFELLENNEHITTKDTMQEIYEEFCWYEGVGEGDANYKVYLNLTNPLIVDAKGRNWNNVAREYSQEIADRYKSLTAEEKDALADLAGWGEYGIFRDEILSVVKTAKAAESDHTLRLDDASINLASAVEKLGGANANLYDAFSIAGDNFSEEAINRFAMKQLTTRDYAKKAKAEGYDGVIFKNIHDNGGYSNGSEGASTVAVAFDSNQIKSVANEKPSADHDIRYSLTEYTDAEKKAHNDLVIDHFGKTYSWRETGYVLLDGTKLDLSGKHEGGPGGYRSVDHRDIVAALGDDYGDDSYSGALIQFMSEGNIRISPESNGINLSVQPNKAQERALSDFISRVRGEVILDIDDANGYTVVSVEYPYGTHFSKVLGDIRGWFENGTKPDVPNTYRSLSKDDIAPVRGRFATPARDLKLETAQNEIAPVREVEQTAEVAPEVGELFPDDLAPIEDEAGRFDSLTDEDAPPEVEAPYYEGNNPVTADDPFYERDITEVGKRSVKAYMYENPEVKPFFQQEAQYMLGDLYGSTKGEKHYADVEYLNDSGYVSQGVWTGTKRHTTDDIAYLLDECGYSYAEIEKGLKAIIEDHGAENNACSKRIEFILNDRLMNGYTDIDGYQSPPNQDYINLLNEKQITEYSEEAFNALTDADAPPVDEIAPVAEKVTAEEDIAPVKEAYEAIRPKREKQPKLIRVDNGESAPDGKQRKWIKTSTESEAVDGLVTEDDIPDDVRYYQVKSNKKTLDAANARLERDGYAKSREYFEGRMTERKLSVEDIALGERLIQEAAKAGDAAAVRDLIVDVSIIGTELGQRVQALSLIQRLTPEGQLKALTRTVERGKAKGDKAFEGVEVTEEMTKKILDVYNNDGTYEQAKLDAVIEEVKQDIAGDMSVGALDYINAWRYLSMLGNPKTHIRNIVSNVAMRGARAVKNVMARTMEDVFLPKQTLDGNANDDIAPVHARTKTWRKSTDAVKDFAKKKMEEMAATISGESKYSEESSIKEKRQIFKTKAVDKVANANTNALEWEDAIFSKPAFRQTLAEYLTANGVKTKEDIKNNPELVIKATEYALDEARKATFRQDSYFATKINEIEKKNPFYGIAIGSTMPFKKTPINIAKTGVAYSPLGFARNVYDAVQVARGNMDASAAIDHLAQTLAGTSLAVIGYALAASGVLNGAGDDDKEGKYDYQLGKQSYSFNFGGNTYSLSWLSPAAMPLLVGANAYEQLVEGKEWSADVVVETLAQTIDPLSEMSFLSSLDDVLSSYDSGVQKFAAIGGSMAQNYITQFIPTLSSQVAAVMDDKKRSTKVAADSDSKFIDGTINQIKYKIPGLRNTLAPTTDIWGGEVKQTENVLARAFETFIAPYSKREDITTAVDEEIKELYRQTGDTGLIPSIPYGYTNYEGEKYNMSDKEYTAFKKQYGQTAFDLMEQLFDTNTYKTADAATKADMVNRVYDYAMDEAKKTYFSKIGVSYTNATEDNVKVYKEDAIKGAIEHDMNPDEYTFYRDYPGKYRFFQKNGISYKDYENADEVGKRAYTWAYENPGKYTMSKAISNDFMEYYGHKSTMNKIKGVDLDGDGKTDSGSKKANIEDYVFSLDLDYGQQAVLFLSKGNNSAKDKAKYGNAILDYLNSRDDLTYEERITILKELEYEVSEDGWVSW